MDRNFLYVWMSDGSVVENKFKIKQLNQLMNVSRHIVLHWADFAHCSQIIIISDKFLPRYETSSIYYNEVSTCCYLLQVIFGKSSCSEFSKEAYTAVVYHNRYWIQIFLSSYSLLSGIVSTHVSVFTECFAALNVRIQDSWHQSYNFQPVDAHFYRHLKL